MEEFTSKEAGKAPVKMIWMFITLGLTVSVFLFFVSVAGSRFGMLFQNVIWSTVPILLLAGSAGICLSRGTLNLALPGTALLAAAVYSQVAVNSGSVGAALFAALGAGAAMGAVNGIFAIQSGRKALLVTAVASLVLGALFTSIGTQILDGRIVNVQHDRSVYRTMGVIFLLLAVQACVLSGLGRNASTNRGEDRNAPTAGGRFMWTFAAGILAALAGAYTVARVNAVSPATFNSHNETVILPALLLAGAMIPNARKSRGEGVCGGIALVLGCLCLGFVVLMFSYFSIEVNVQRIIILLACIALLIPNILIRRGSA